MPTYIVSGFQRGTYQTYEIKKPNVNDVMSHAESIGVEAELIKCPARHEVYRKEGKDWKLDSYQPPQRISQAGEQNVLHLASFLLPPVGLVWGGILLGLRKPGGTGALVACGFGLVAWGIGYWIITTYVL